MADQGRSGHHGMGDGSMGGKGMGMGGMRSRLLGGAGDVDYPHYVINGKTAAAPSTLTVKPGQRVRMRIINAGTDTAFRVALGGHRVTVTHSDGFPVQHQEGDAVLIGMGERYDVMVMMRDGVFPLVASAEGKRGHGLAVVRTASSGHGTPCRAGRPDRSRDRAGRVRGGPVDRQAGGPDPTWS